MTRKVIHVFWDTDMRCRHDGLIARAKKEKVKFEELDPGQILVFINHAKDRLMVLTPTDEDNTLGVLGYYRSPTRRIDPMAIQYISLAFGGQGFDFKRSIKASLLERLGYAPKPSRQLAPGESRQSIQ